MLATELNARARNLLADQKARDDEARRRKAREAALNERQRQREAEREEAARLKRQAEQEAAEKAARQVEADTEWNRGVYLAAALQAVEADDMAPLARGIKRSKDKVVLPASIGAALMDQDATKNGAMLFELRSDVTGAVTHAGVLDFTAPEGVVQLPLKVRECLFGNGGTVQGIVHVKYKRLQKGSFVRFQPLSRGFHDTALDVRAVLEACLMQHTTLSVGDAIRVDAGGSEQTLRVVELRPDPAVSVIDTDVEAEVVASVETEQLVRAWEDEQARNAARLAELRAAREAEEVAQRVAAEEAARVQAEAEARARDDAERVAVERAARRQARLAALAPEPQAQQGGEQQAVVCAVRLPDGSRPQRRFLPATPLADLFQFVDAYWEPDTCGEYCLVTQFPRRVLGRPGTSDASDAATPSLQTLGLGQGGQELFLLEPLAPA